MTKLNKAQKLVTMIGMMSRRGGVHAFELMKKFDLDARTLRRYISDLRKLEIPIVDEGRSDDRIIDLDPRWKRTGVQLSLAEALSLHFGRVLYNFLDGTSFASELDGAIERLEPAISRTHADFVRQLDTKFIAVSEHSKDYRMFGHIIDEIVMALVHNYPIDAHYRKPNGVHNAYHLHPYTLAVYRQGLYLFALDNDAGQVKTFALERFNAVACRRNERFEIPNGWSPRAYLAHAFGIINGSPEEIVLAFVEELGSYIRERTWHPTQTFRTLPDGRLELRLQIAISVEIESWIRGFGPDCEILGPPHLVEKIARSLRVAANRYRNVPE